MHSRFNLVAFITKPTTIMAKSKSFFGLRRGSTKSMTFQVNRGMQITKDRVYDVANPRTVPQMAQRLTFANASKFYKAAVQALFKFAYEGKDSNETDYNAFMRINAKNACCASKKMLELNYPAIGSYVLTDGSLGSVDPVFSAQETGGATGNYYTPGVIYDGDVDPDTITAGEVWKMFLDKYPQFQDGDIVTVVKILAEDMKPVTSIASAKENNALMGLTIQGGAIRPVWEIKQYIINSQSTEIATSGSAIPWVVDDTEATGEMHILGGSYNLTNEPVLALAFIVSRPLGGNTVKVTTSKLIPTDATSIAIAIGMGDEWKRYCAETYEMAVSTLDADAILKGEIVAQTKILQYEAPSSSTVTTRTKVTTILNSSNVPCESVTCTVTVGSDNKTATFSSYVFAKDNDVNKRMAQYKTPDGNTIVQLPVEGTTVVAGNVYLQSTTAAKLVSINK